MQWIALLCPLVLVTANQGRLIGIDPSIGLARLAVYQNDRFTHYSTSNEQEVTGSASDEASVLKRLLGVAGFDHKSEITVAATTSVFADFDDHNQLKEAAKLAGLDLHSSVARWEAALFAYVLLFPPMFAEGTQILLVDLAADTAEFVLAKPDEDTDDFELDAFGAFALQSDQETHDILPPFKEAYDQALQDNDVPTDVNIHRIVVIGHSDRSSTIVQELRTLFPQSQLWHDAELSPWMAARGAALEAGHPPRDEFLSFHDEL